jgi:tRNA(His) guanylyltransferase
MKDELGKRMKENYEVRTRTYLPSRTYTIVRLDGKGFSKYTKNMGKPFDKNLSDIMDETTKFLCDQLNCKFGYTQSDEISLLFTDFENENSQQIFNGQVQKIVSIAASMATAKFNQLMMVNSCHLYDDELVIPVLTDSDMKDVKLAFFDARVFIIPDFREVSNYFIWRQQDCTRNSISMAAQSVYSHNELEGKSSSNKQEMLFQKGINWNDYPDKFKRGVVIKKETFEIPVHEKFGGGTTTRKRWTTVKTPIFTQEREFLYEMIPIIGESKD